MTSYEFLGQKSGKTLCFRFQLTTKSEKQSVCKNDILSSYSFSPQDLLKASSKSFFISILLKGSKSLFKNGNKTEKTMRIFLEKRVKLEWKDFPPTPMFFPGKKSLTCNLLRIFLRKLKYIFQKLSLQNNMFRNCLYKWNMCKQISNLCFHSFLKNWVILLLVLSTLVKCNIVYSLSTF